jgi:5-formyltetrahydrofolate cyclo-ligase
MSRAAEKDELRKRVLARRARLSPEKHRQLSGIITARLMDDKRLVNAKTIFSYWPFGSEVDIAAFNNWAVSRGATLAFPLCHEGGVMEAAVPKSADALQKGCFGIVEPDPQRSRIILPEEFDIVLVPCVGFDNKNIRLGMGGGFYDRYLPNCAKALKLGVAFSLQKIKEGFSDPWDIALDEIITN